MWRPILLLALMLATPVWGDAGYCASHADIAKTLESQLGEERQGVGLRDPDSALELWVSERGTWTLVTRYANGRSCIVALGEDWQHLADLGS